MRFSGDSRCRLLRECLGGDCRSLEEPRRLRCRRSRRRWAIESLSELLLLLLLSELLLLELLLRLDELELRLRWRLDLLGFDRRGESDRLRRLCRVRS